MEALASVLMSPADIVGSPRSAEHGATPMPSLQAQEHEASAAVPAAVSRGKWVANRIRTIEESLEKVSPETPIRRRKPLILPRNTHGHHPAPGVLEPA